MEKYKYGPNGALVFCMEYYIFIFLLFFLVKKNNKKNINLNYIIVI